jgi:hypothetical protein
MPFCLEIPGLPYLPDLLAFTSRRVRVSPVVSSPIVFAPDPVPWRSKQEQGFRWKRSVGAGERHGRGGEAVQESAHIVWVRSQTSEPDFGARLQTREVRGQTSLAQPFGSPGGQMIANDVDPSSSEVRPGGRWGQQQLSPRRAGLVTAG